MKYYLCIVGNFEGAQTIYQECIERRIYQYHDTTRQKGPVYEIAPGDVLVLTTNKQLKGYGIATSKAVLSNCGHDEHWWSVSVKDGWRLVEEETPLPYGVYWNTVRGTKQSIVKEMDSSWSGEVIQQLKRLRKENIEERAFPLHLSELAMGLNSNVPFYKIPEIQRGLVWNATRCEVLWDSILRGIPIGAISLRPTNDGCWEIFDGQQRSNAVAMGYAKWQSLTKDDSILWIDLNPEKLKERKFVLRVTTPAHPWGYRLSNDEKTDNRLTAGEQREAVDGLNGCWENASKKGARPSPRELWPVKAKLPVPFSVLRSFVERNSSQGTASFDGFVRYCKQNFSNCHWMRLFISESLSQPEEWSGIVKAIDGLSNYEIVALNGADIAFDDLALYFKRMNKQGVEPDDEEIRYSMLKARVPGLKKLDDVAKTRTRAAWLADIAVRFWLSKRNDWEWHRNVSPSDIASFSSQEEGKAFAAFIDNDFECLLKRFETLLKGTNGNGLLSWHIGELYRHGRGDCLTLYFLRELDTAKPTNAFIGLATTILWFGWNIPKCAENLWKAPDVSTGLFRSMQERALARLFDEEELEKWADGIKKKLKTDDWGDRNVYFQDPYIGQALGRIWNGFNADGPGCSLLLFACRKFMTDYFGNYADASPEWREQNRPWDYDHVLPKSWVAERRVSGFSYLVRDFLWSIGNSAPLPFSLNREKNAGAPDNYPDGTEESAFNLHVKWLDVNQFGKEKYDKLDKNKEASARFVRATIERMLRMLNDWYCTCRIGELMSFASCRDPRRILFEELQEKLEASHGFNGNRSGVWFVCGMRQHAIRSPIDWARPWLACGFCGRIRVPSTPQSVRCLLGVASDGKTLDVGIRRHPSGEELPRGTWWLNDSCSSFELNNTNTDDIIAKLKAIMDEVCFTAEQS